MRINTTKIELEGIKKQLKEARARNTRLSEDMQFVKGSYEKEIEIKDKAFSNVVNQIETLKGELVAKDQQLRYVKTHCVGYGKWERFVAWVKGTFKK